MNLNLAGADIVGINGRFVSQRVSQVVQAIHEYEPTIEVQYIPESARTEGQSAFRLIHRPDGQEPYVMFTVRREEDMTSEILGKIMANDNRNNPLNMTEVELFEAAQAATDRQAHLDRLEEANDIAFHVLRTKKNDYVVNKDLRIKDGIPFNVAGM